MGRILDGLHRATPAIVMTVGCGPFYWADVPDEVRAGGVCLTAIALMLADIQNDKKLGYTNAVVAAVRRVPGMENADEGTVLGLLTLGASVCLGPPMTADMLKNGAHAAGLFNNFENYIAFPLGAAFSFASTRRLLEKCVGKEMRFSYTDAEGKARQTQAIDTGRLLQQVAYLAGAGGICGMGASLGSNDILFTGLCFAAAVGLSIQRLVQPAANEVMLAKAEAVGKHLQAALGDEERKDAKAHLRALAGQWKAALQGMDAGEPLKSQDLKDMGRRLGAALASVVEQQVRPPSITRDGR